MGQNETQEQVDPREMLIRFANELTNDLKSLSSEKFNQAKLDMVRKHLSYFIERVKDNDVDAVLLTSLFLNVFKLFNYNKSLDRLGIILDNVFKDEVIRGIRELDRREEG